MTTFNRFGLLALVSTLALTACVGNDPTQGGPATATTAVEQPAEKALRLFNASIDSGAQNRNRTAQDTVFVYASTDFVVDGKSWTCVETRSRNSTAKLDSISGALTLGKGLFQKATGKSECLEN